MVGNCVAPSRFRRQCAGPCRPAAVSKIMRAAVVERLGKFVIRSVGVVGLGHTTMTGWPRYAGFSCCSHDARKALRSRNSHCTGFDR